MKSKKFWNTIVLTGALAGTIGGVQSIRNGENIRAHVAAVEQERNVTPSEELRRFAEEGTKSNSLTKAMAAVNGNRKADGLPDIAPDNIYTQLMGNVETQYVNAAKGTGNPLIQQDEDGAPTRKATLLVKPTPYGDIYIAVPESKVTDRPPVEIYMHAEKKLDGTLDLGQPAGTLTPENGHTLLNRGGSVDDYVSQARKDEAAGLAATIGQSQGAANAR